MDAHIERFLERVDGLKSDSTYKKRLYDLRDFDQWLDENEISATETEPQHLDRYFICLTGDGYAPITIGGKYDSIRAFYNELCGLYDERDDNPIDDLEKSEYTEQTSRKHDEADISYVTPEEVEKLCQHVPTPKVRNKTIIRFLFQTGIREGELAILKQEDLNRNERSIEVWAPKTKNSRTVFYQPSLGLLLDQWLDGGYRARFTNAATSPYLFVSRKAERLRTENVGRMVKKAAENAGVQEVLYTDQRGHERNRITSHALRHGHAIHALKSGIDVRTVQEHLGHAKIETTMKYLQLIDDDVKESYRRFGSVESAES